MPSETRHFGDVTVEESDTRFETFEVLIDKTDQNVHHKRVSLKRDKDGEPKKIVIKDFVDESTPHGGRYATEIRPENIDKLINALEIIKMEEL